MATTALQAFPYPAGSDSPAGMTQILALANAVEKTVVMVFASSAARTSALSAAGVTATEGMLSWLQDVNRYEFHTGSAWTPLLTSYSELQIGSPNLGDFNNASMADWVTGLSVAVPPWARDGAATAAVVFNAANLLTLTAASVYAFRTVITATNGTTAGNFTTPINQVFAVTVGQSAFTIPAASTTLAVKVQAQRVSGTGGLRFNSANGAQYSLLAVIQR